MLGRSAGAYRRDFRRGANPPPAFGRAPAGTRDADARRAPRSPAGVTAPYDARETLPPHADELTVFENENGASSIVSALSLKLKLRTGEISYRERDFDTVYKFPRGDGNDE